MASPTKLLFIGLDSAEPALMSAWEESGDLPTIRALRQRGAWAAFESPRGFGNGVLWPTLFTGVNAGKHGRYFARQIRCGRYTAAAFGDADYKRQPFWAALSDAGLRSAVIDMVRAPLTEGINGLQVVDWMAHDPDSPVIRCQPSDLAREVVERFGSDPLEGEGDAVGRGLSEYRQLRDGLIRRIDQKTEMSCHYLERGDWDLFMTVFADPHDVGHQFWHLHDPTFPLYDAELAAQLGDPIKQVYVALDQAVARLVAAAGDDAVVVLFAGPGIGPNYTANHLLDGALRRLEGDPRTSGDIAVDRLKAVYRKVVPAAIRNRARTVADRTDEALKEADRSRRKCFVIPHNDNAGAIRINLVGREPSGLVRRGAEMDAYCRELTEDLLAMTDPESGRPVVADVVRVAAEYDGAHLDALPDLLAIWNREGPIGGMRSAKIGEIRKTYPGNRTGDHTTRCLMIVDGASTHRGELEREVSAVDIAPTLAAMLDVTLTDVDGAVIPELLPRPPAAGTTGAGLAAG